MDSLAHYTLATFFFYFLNELRIFFVFQRGSESDLVHLILRHQKLASLPTALFFPNSLMGCI